MTELTNCDRVRRIAVLASTVMQNSDVSSNSKKLLEYIVNIIDSQRYIDKDVDKYEKVYWTNNIPKSKYCNVINWHRSLDSGGNNSEQIILCVNICPKPVFNIQKIIGKLKKSIKDCNTNKRGG